MDDRRFEESTQIEQVDETEYLLPKECDSWGQRQTVRVKLVGRLMKKHYAAIIVAVALILLCEFALVPLASDPNTYVRANQTLDQQKDSVLGLVATSTSASVAVTLIPDDVGTPIANQLADLSGKLAVVLAIIYLEKFLMTGLGLLSMRFVVPIGIGLLALCQVAKDVRELPRLRVVGAKLVVAGVLLVMFVPASTGLADFVNEQYGALEQAQAAQEQAEQSSENAESTSEGQDQSQGDGNILDFLGNALENGVNALTTGAQDAAQAVGDALNSLIDAVAVMIVTSCLIPLVMLLLYGWIFKLITGVDTSGYLAKASSSVSSSVKNMGVTAKGIKTAASK